jgi:hypothetical protein
MRSHTSLKIVRLRDGVVVQSQAGGAVVVDPTGGGYFQVNAMGHELVLKLLHSASEADLIKTLQLRFGLSRERAQRDVQEFLELLRTQTMLDESA